MKKILSLILLTALCVAGAKAQTWNFSGMTIPYADNGSTAGGLWYNPTDKNSQVQTDRVQNGTNFTNEELYYYADADAKTAGTKTTFAPTQGLKFTTTNNNYSLEIRGNLIYISRTGVVVTIPGCKKGQTISVKIQAGDKGRGFTTTNLSNASMTVSNKNTWETFTATVVADGDVKLTSNNGISLQTIMRYYEVNVANIGWASHYFPFDAVLPSGVKAYYAKSASASSIVLSEITSVVPANTGVVLSAEEGKYNFDVAAETATPISDNLFEGVTAETVCEANANYVLSGESSAETPVFGLYTGTTLGAYKAYLPATKVPSVQNAKRLSFSFEDSQTTGIDTVKSISNAPAARKVLRNGRIEVITAKGTFNVASAQLK